jgi:hypothetical protein
VSSGNGRTGFGSGSAQPGWRMSQYRVQAEGQGHLLCWKLWLVLVWVLALTERRVPEEGAKREQEAHRTEVTATICAMQLNVQVP